MEPWAFLRLIFAILGCVGRVMFFDAFLGRQKDLQKSQKSATLAAKGKVFGKSGSARRNARGHRGGDYGEGQRSFHEFLHAV
jgi:hypothetical protein